MRFSEVDDYTLTVPDCYAAALADGPIDILVNNAGMQFRAPLEDFPIDRWQALMTTNVSSLFYVSQPDVLSSITSR
jgi:NAD(P)-dependent dehydrogenase (short-subunit alcohol dehydrogenase family)